MVLPFLFELEALSMPSETLLVPHAPVKRRELPLPPFLLKFFSDVTISSIRGKSRVSGVKILSTQKKILR